MSATYKLIPQAVGQCAADGKRAILNQLASNFAAAYGLDPDKVLEGLEEREALGSTGFGRGVAIPHARIEGLNRPVAAFLQLDHPVQFAAADGLPVELVFGLLSPVQAGTSHLHALAAISRLMRDDDLRADLSSAAGAAEIYALLADVADRDAA